MHNMKLPWSRLYSTVQLRAVLNFIVQSGLFAVTVLSSFVNKAIFP